MAVDILTCTVDGIGSRTGPPRNSPLAVAGVLALVLTVVGVTALAGRATVRVAGTAAADPAAAAVAAAPVAPRSRPAGEPLLSGDLVLGEVVCVLPDLGATNARLRAFHSAALDCLGEAWRPALRASGATFTQARLEIDPGPGSACGKTPGEDQATAFYCGREETIYLPRRRVLDHLGLHVPAHLAVLAHEYGHHVQERGGILDAAGRRLRHLGQGTPAELRLTRRLELQANCFAGLFLASVAGRGSVTTAQAEEALADFRHGVDSETHGTVANQLRWARTGFTGTSVAACDTWRAPAHAVR